MLQEPLFGSFDGAKSGEHMLGPIQTVGGPMKHYPHQEEVDFCIVGVGAAGGVLLQRLARAGFSVIGFDVGPFWDVERDWVSDEKASHKLYWNALRITGGKDPITLGANNSGRGVGGGTVHWSAFTPRLHPSDFRVYTQDGVGVDWPISYDDLKPYYELMEREIPVSGPAYFPWGDQHGYPYAPLHSGGVADVFTRGCMKLGIRVVVGGPVAIISGAHADRPPCIYRGFCLQGCKVGAKQSTLISHVPDAIHHGAEVRSRCMVGRINLGKDGLVKSLTYFDPEGKVREQRAKVVIVSGYAIETPRLLLNSACPGYEHGLANSSGLVGKYLMVQTGNVVLGRFSELIRMYKTPPANAETEEFYETDPERGFVRGYTIQTVAPLPVAISKEMITAKGAWGWNLRRLMMDYNHWAGVGLLGEILPHEENRVQLADVTDDHGLPVAKVTFALHENDRKLMHAGVQKMVEIMQAARAQDIAHEQRFAHLVGGARMGHDPQTSVVDSFGCTHDIANLYVCDGSVFPTEGAVNPGLTIQALAARTADYLISNATEVLAGRRGTNKHPPVRQNISPPATYGRGVPRIRK
jgi:choline dehydrogenase-like flavoprotein